MISKCVHLVHMASCHIALVLTIVITLLASSSMVVGSSSNKVRNVVDECWRSNPKWHINRQELAKCSIGYAGKMTRNAGPDVTEYVVTDPSDDAVNPKPGTLRYAMTSIGGKKWVTFKRDMKIKLQRPLLVSSFSTIDGRGASVHIAGGACLLLQRVTDVIIHGLRIHDCQMQGPGPVRGPDAKIVNIGHADGDAIRMLSSSKIWIDHNTLYDCPDGLIDVTRGSTDVTISNNWFRYQNKVMLLGHDDGFLRDRNMKVTVVFNYFGPNCHQRMPRVRFGYAHVVNNLYQGWGLYAIGGSMNPSVKSQANLFVAPKTGNKEVVWNKNRADTSSNLWSVNDIFENGASFNQQRTNNAVANPNYNQEQQFKVADATSVRQLTQTSGALRCSKRSTC
ncbi:Pectate lyase [Heracleum sosnowskyi]|uniref:Pectate lyase n=1 Tax=Heracleum sosnowskyi TaxID=360622 RepID=A0AAD8LVM3_9APIA|nr:Pectate lyase [Heracleum sosnowskyi]